jgi:hypothetical protein
MGRRSGDNGCGTRRRGLGGCLCLLALEDGFECVSGLGNLGEVKLRLDVGRPVRTGSTTVSAVEIVAHLLGLIGLDRTGMRLSRDANCFKRVQNRPALYFQFSCQIVDSNFAHPSLFASLRP